MSVTMEQWRQASTRTVAGRLHFTITNWDFIKPQYAEWVEVVEAAVMDAMSKMVRRRNNLHNMAEDELTALLVIALEQLTLEASSKVVNGNCDVEISYDNYQWLGEAKIARDYATIYGGYLQLTQRYTPGTDNQSAGGMLLYCVDQSAKPLLEGWKAALAVAVPASNIREAGSPLVFRSTDIVRASGLPIDVLHMAFALHHDPQEKVMKLPKSAQQAGRRAKRKTKKEQALGTEAGDDTQPPALREDF